MADLAVCVDFGSTFTKALLVDLVDGTVVAGAEHPTTLETDVLDGYDACLAVLAEADPRAATAQVLACSSAGGGLRIAVVGNEELVTAEAGRRVALSSGGKVVDVLAAGDGGFEARFARTSATVQADVVLLTGGTDGGNREVIVRAARGLVEAGWRGPVVVAGNVEARDEVSAVLADVPHVLADNVVPQIGVLAPGSARSAIREVFLSHVIGGKHLSQRADFTSMVRGATPDVVLTGVELLGQVVGEVVVVDVGGATTDVHSVVEVDPEQGATEGGLARDVVAPTPVNRTVEGDLGMRWSAVSTVEEAELPELAKAATRRREEPGFLPTSEAEHDEDEAIARAAVSLAVRRHAGRSRVVPTPRNPADVALRAGTAGFRGDPGKALVSPEGRVVERTGIDLREVDLVVGSGGVLRHGRPGVDERVLGSSVGEDGDWQLPEHARVVVDVDYVLAAAGLLASDHPDAARRLVSRLAVTLTQ